jgi:hypothetical protein
LIFVSVIGLKRTTQISSGMEGKKPSRYREKEEDKGDESVSVREDKGGHWGRLIKRMPTQEGFVWDLSGSSDEQRGNETEKVQRFSGLSAGEEQVGKAQKGEYDWHSSHFLTHLSCPETWMIYLYPTPPPSP